MFDKAKCDEFLNTGLIGGESEIEEYERGGTPWPITYTFMPDEIISILSGFGVKDIHLAGPGAYARMLSHKVLQRILKDPLQRADFLDFCYMYDKHPSVYAMGKDNLLAVGSI